MHGHLIALLLVMAIVAPAAPVRGQTDQAACARFLFVEDAARSGVACALPGVAETGIVRSESTGRRGRIAHITDGDTLRATFGGDEETIRLFAVNTPEINPTECYGVEATALLSEPAPVGSVVWFERGETATDRYGRSLYWAWIETGPGRWQLLQDAIVSVGAGEVRIYPPDERYADWLMLRESQAQAAGLGMWSACADLTPTPKPGTASSAACDPAYPDVCIRPLNPGGDLDCSDIPYRRFRVLPSDPHRFDGDGNGIGCEFVDEST
jgi:micrococcal nuclease